MEKTIRTPILQKEITGFLKANKNIKEALELFQISDAQYQKAIESIEPKATTTNKAIITIEY